MATSVVGRMAAILSLDAKGFTTGFRDAEQRLTRFANQAKRTGQALSLSLTAPLVAFGALALREASRVEELRGRFDAAFGDNAASVRSWAASFGAAINASTNELEAFAGQVGDVLRTLDLGTESTAALSTGIVQLAADLADFRGLENAEVVNAFTGALRGQSRALLQLGVSAQDIERKLQELGLEEGTKAAGDMQKAIAGLLVVLDESAPALGSAAKSANELDGVLQGLAAVVKDVGIAVGQILGETVTRIGPLVIELGRNFLAASDDAKRWAVGMAAAAAAAGPLLLAVAGLAAGLSALAGFVTKLAAALAFLALNPMVIVIAAFAALVLLVTDTGGALRDLIALIPGFGLTFAREMTRARIAWLEFQAEIVKPRGGLIGALDAVFGDPEQQARDFAEVMGKLEQEKLKLDDIDVQIAQGGSAGSIGSGRDASAAVAQAQAIAAQLKAQLEALFSGLDLNPAFLQNMSDKLAKEAARAMEKRGSEMANALGQLADQFARLDAQTAGFDLSPFQQELLEVRRDAEEAARALLGPGSAEEAVRKFGDAAEQKLQIKGAAEFRRDIADLKEDLNFEASLAGLRPVDAQIQQIIQSIREWGRETGRTAPEIAAAIASMGPQFAEVRRQADLVRVNVGEALTGAVRGTLVGIIDGSLTAQDVLKRFADSALQGVEDFFLGALAKKLDFDAVWQQNWLEDLPGLVGKGLKAAGSFFDEFIDLAIRGVKALINWLLDAITLQNVLNAAKAVGTAVSGVLGLIGLADGGIVSSPGIFAVGESGPEAVIPLDRLGEMRAGGGGDVFVNIEDRAGVQKRESHKTRPNGDREINLILEAVANDVRTGGRVGRSIDQTRGTRQVGTLR